MRVLGSVDRCDEALIEGWITVVGNPSDKLDLEVMLRGEVIGRCVADQFRQDLKDADIGDGHCAFSFPIPSFVPASEIRQIAVRLAESVVILPRQEGSADESTGRAAAETVSRFGGLWIDRYDWNRSQQAIHMDTTYVKIDSNPMHLAVTWLALEDVQPGTGELEFYVGSHHAPDFLFGGQSKWIESHTADHARFLPSLHDDAKTLGHVKSSFLAKKGDVLVWHSDLAHGGSPIGQPPRTRKSLVTHLTPASDELFYRWTSSYGRLRSRGAASCRSIRMWGRWVNPQSFIQIL